MSSVRRVDRVLRFSIVPIALVAAGAWGQDAVPDYQIEYSGSPDAVIIEYDVESAFQSTADSGEPLLRIYGDGRVRVYRPKYSPGAGSYETYVPTAELEQLLAELQAEGVLAYNSESVAKRKLEAQRARLAEARVTGELVVNYRSDVDLSVFRIELESYQASGTAARQSSFTKEIRCIDLQREATEYPQIPELARIARIENTLISLASDSRLKKLEE
jgi:hypothetical protein